MQQLLTKPAFQQIVLLLSMFCSIFIALVLIGCGGHDDSHISFWPAYTLANFGEIVNYNGKQLEQSSSLLWVLLLALLHKISAVEISTLGYSISLFFGVLFTPLFFYLTKNILSTEKRIAVVVLLPVFLAWQFWMVSGMEFSFYALLLALLILQLAQDSADWKKLIPVLLAVLLARPESPLVLIAFFALFFSEQNFRKQNNNFLPILIFTLVCFAILFVIRTFYFSYGFPLPVYSKVAWQFENILSGVAYLIVPILSDLAMLPVAILFAGSLIKGFTLKFEAAAEQKFLYLAHRLILIQLLFVVFSGGDWMRHFRFLIPVFPLWLVLTVCMISDLKKPKNIALSTIFTLSCFVSLLMNIGPGIISYPLWITKQLQQAFPSHHNYFEYSSREHFSNIFILPVLKDIVQQSSNHLERPVVIMSGQMGMTSYYLAKDLYGSFYLYDRYSLVSDELHACEGFGTWRGGSFGQMLDHLTLAKQHETFWHECDLQRPDIVYDIWAGDPEPITSMGYEVVYAQYGKIKTRDFLSPEIVLKGQIIAVDKKLLADLPGLKTENMIFQKTEFAKQF